MHGTMKIILIKIKNYNLHPQEDSSK